MIRQILDLFLPPRCSLCGSDSGDFVSPLLCEECHLSFRPFRAEICGGCFRPADPDRSLCIRCRKAYPFRRMVVGFIYEGRMVEAIAHLKYRNLPRLADPLADLLAPTCAPLSADGVTAVPLHPSRFRERGYNQSLLIAAVLARRLGLPLLPMALVRIRPTPPQVGLTGSEREENVAGAFEAPSSDRIAERRLILVDDVFTTGATISNAASALRAAGTKEVIPCALARML